MEAEFENFWQHLQAKIRRGMIIPNWTYLHGYMGDTMRIEDIDELEVVVKAPKAKSLQRVSKEDFEKVWKIWPAYRTGRLQRKDMLELTRYSKYVMSIIHWLEKNE